MKITDRYLNPFTDFGFKKLFGSEFNKDILEIPRFDKEISELGTRFEKWLFLLKHLPDFRKRPAELEERIFGKVFEIAEIAKLNKKDMETYEQSMKEYRDYKNTISTAREEGVLEGLKKGLEKGRVETAQMMIDEGFDNALIAKITHLSEDEVEKLRKE